MNRTADKKKMKKIVFYVILTIIAVIWLIPIVTVFLTSIKSTQDFYTGAILRRHGMLEN